MIFFPPPVSALSVKFKVSDWVIKGNDGNDLLIKIEYCLMKSYLQA